jgi:serine/threonine-protein kinase
MPWLRFAIVPLLSIFSLAHAASPAAAQDNYGAIAYAQSSGATGYSYDFRSRDGAEERALQECGRGCEVVIWFKNACAALATGDKNGYGSGWASSRSRAEEIALMVCEENTDNCAIKQWVCTTR